MAQSANLGFPRIGADRELKHAIEAYWAGRLPAHDLHETARRLRAAHWGMQQDAGIALIPSNDFSLYDHVLDTAMLVGAVPERYGRAGGSDALATYFALARGVQTGGRDVAALALTKWFDTNYHYIVPELGPETRLCLSATRPFDAFSEALALGVRTRPVLLGPVSFLLLSRSTDSSFDPLERLLDPLVEIYGEVIRRLGELGAEWIQVDEPCLVQDRTPAELAALERAYSRLADHAGSARLLVQTYFGDVGAAYPVLARLPVAGIGLDFTRGDNLALLTRHGLPADRILSAGIVDGRNVWINDLESSLGKLDAITAHVAPDRLILAPSCSLLHVPLDAGRETALDPELRSWLAFARQKLDEVATLTRAVNEGRAAIDDELARNRTILRTRAASARTRDPEVRVRTAQLDPAGAARDVAYGERRTLQQARLALPALPTTVVGSFPQHAEVRAARRRYHAGEIGAEEYERFLQKEVERAVQVQEAAGIDVPAHGEFERGDMVEYFAERFDGYAFTRHGWVQSFGTRCVKPPILFGDVRRPAPVTVAWWQYAQSLTNRPMKAILTGPVTLLQWSFVRDDQPRSDTCVQLALAVRDEVLDLERAGAAVIQVDEPALREGMPLRHEQAAGYLAWAVGCFRLATGGVRSDTQIQTHMCYSEFNGIMDAIEQLDADVLLIENARSNEALLEVFRERGYPRDIGPGVYDIHSPRVPSADEMAARLQASLRVLPATHVWVTPDCGLKTRTYEDVEPALANMVRAARTVRAACISRNEPPLSGAAQEAVRGGVASETGWALYLQRFSALLEE
ncbi:MAG TPA: 5-methyltetrahydropteroyltriglutamate--homocysteine S-methyltransferase [Longimicrobiales bacterium]|nr:5-methyltetrahydropteroyltriglutamate--homocysteine S-methyltransferase [Longimicrobiales bacterium]